MTDTLIGYSVAVRLGPRPRHVLHVMMNSGPAALCGAGPVVFIGDTDRDRVNIDEAIAWPFCERCVAATPKDVMDDWLPGAGSS